MAEGHKFPKPSFTKLLATTLLFTALLAITATACSDTNNQQASQLDQLQRGQRELRNEIRDLTAEIQKLDRQGSETQNPTTQQPPPQIIEREVPVEVIVERQVLVEKEVPIEVIKEVIKEVEILVPVEREVIVEKEVIVEVEKEVPVEVIIEVIQEVENPCPDQQQDHP